MGGALKPSNASPEHKLKVPVGETKRIPAVDSKSSNSVFMVRFDIEAHTSQMLLHGGL